MPIKCRVCGFDKHIEGAEFCQKCGSPLQNYCTNKMCDMNNGELTTLSDAEEDSEE